MQYSSFNIIRSPIPKPGACHRARFMASCLYLYKIYMFQSQFLVLTPEQASEVGIMVEYIALIHVPYFLQLQHQLLVKTETFGSICLHIKIALAITLYSLKWLVQFRKTFTTTFGISQSNLSY